MIKNILNFIPVLLISITSQAQNRPPSISNIPNQVADTDGLFSILNLNDYLFEPEGDAVQWTYYQTNTMANGDKIDWNYTNQSPSMTLLGRIKVRGEFPFDAKGDVLMAYHEDDIKGIASATLLIPGYYLFFLTIDGDNAGDEIRFKYFDASQSTTFDMDHSVKFVSQQTFGSPASPYEMDAGFMSVLDQGIPNTGILYPRAFESDWVGVDTFYVVAQELSTLEKHSDTAMVIFGAMGSGLPLDLLSFSVDKINSHAQLKWQIENAVDVRGFEVQHQRDNIFNTDFPWSAIEFVDFQEGEAHFQFRHYFPINGAHYYRLKIIDDDENYFYSDVIRLKQNTELNLQVFPNPTMDVIQVNVEVAADAAQRMVISNSFGAIVHEEQLLAQIQGRKSYTVDLSWLPAGMYQVSVYGNGKMSSQWIALQK